MLYLNNVTSDASQELVFTGIPGLTITITLRYLPRAQLWIAGFDDGSNSIQGITVVNSLNLLRPWRNNIPYGMACIRADGLDPYLITDFTEQLANLYMLDSADVAVVEQDWFT